MSANILDINGRPMSNVPIIGQPEVKAFSITVVFKCSCGGILMIQGGVGAGVACKCRNTFVVGRAMLAPDGSGGVSFATSRLPEGVEP